MFLGKRAHGRDLRVGAVNSRLPAAAVERRFHPYREELSIETALFHAHRIEVPIGRGFVMFRPSSTIRCAVSACRSMAIARS